MILGSPEAFVAYFTLNLVIPNSTVVKKNTDLFSTAVNIGAANSFKFISAITVRKL